MSKYNWILVVPILVSSLSALATKPCGPDTWFAKKDRSEEEWKKLATWVAIGTVTARDERLQPFPNCYLEDMSKCSMEDASVVTVKVTKVEKGAIEKGSKLKLGSAYCALDPPQAVGKRTDSAVLTLITSCS